jgi:hypothetical protein
MSNMGKSHLVIMFTVGPHDVAEGDRLFASHGEFMKGRPREGDVALLGYTVSKGPELSNPMNPNSEPTGNTTFVVVFLRVSSRHRQALAGHDGQLAGDVLRRAGVVRQGHDRDAAQRQSCPGTLVGRSSPPAASRGRRRLRHARSCAMQGLPALGVAGVQLALICAGSRCQVRGRGLSVVSGCGCWGGRFRARGRPCLSRSATPPGGESAT